MSDIVERLRDHATDWNGAQMPDLEPAKGDPTAGTLREAAAEITRLRADLAAAQEREQRMREALARLEAMVRILPPEMDEPGSALAQARAALSAMRGEP